MILVQSILYVYQVESLNSVVNFYGQFPSDFLSEFGFLSTGKSILTRFPFLRNEQHLIRRSNKLFSTKKEIHFPNVRIKFYFRNQIDTKQFVPCNSSSSFKPCLMDRSIIEMFDTKRISTQGQKVPEFTIRKKFDFWSLNSVVFVFLYPQIFKIFGYDQLKQKICYFLIIKISTSEWMFANCIKLVLKQLI